MQSSSPIFNYRGFSSKYPSGVSAIGPKVRRPDCADSDVQALIDECLEARGRRGTFSTAMVILHTTGDMNTNAGGFIAIRWLVLTSFN
jgi:hypothetical protein